jgi:ABC-type amino acid transport substrate-binding protein
MKRIMQKRLIAFLIVFGFSLSAWASGDLAGVKERGVLRHLGIPYANFVTGSGDGLSIELMQLFAKELGVRYEYVESDFSKIIPELTGKTQVKGQDGKTRFEPYPIKGDVIASGLTVLPWRKELVAFSSATFPTQIWLMTTPESELAPIVPSQLIENDINNVKALLKGRNLLVKSGTCLDPTLYKLAETGAKLKDFPGGLNDLFPAVIQGEAEATILDVPDALIAMNKWGGKIKVIGPLSEEQTMAEAFRKEDSQLHAAYETFLAKAKKDGTYLGLIQKYYPDAVYYYAKFFDGCAEPNSKSAQIK